MARSTTSLRISDGTGPRVDGSGCGLMCIIQSRRRPSSAASGCSAARGSFLSFRTRHGSRAISFGKKSAEDLLRWNFGAGERRISIRTPLALRNSFGTLYRLSIRARARSRVRNHATTPPDRWRGASFFFKTRPPSGRDGGRFLQRTTYSNKRLRSKSHIASH